ncbi:MAG TPA: DNA-binding domain-containing protein [Polyangiaceae bacterium]
MTTRGVVPVRLPLGRLQRWFAAVTTHSEGIAAGVFDEARGLGIGVPSLAELERVVTPGPRLSALERLQIYSEGYHSRLVECLADDYPAVRYALGEASFEQLAREYIRQYPSRSSSLNEFGRNMPGFIASATTPCRCFLSELAELEWALVEVIHAASGSTLDRDLASVPAELWPFARFRRNPALRVLRFAHPVNTFFQSFKEDLEPAIPSQRPSAVAVYRRGQTIWRLDLSLAMASLLAHLVAGNPLGEALERLAADHPEAEVGVAENFDRWLSLGFFSAIELP